ncbi:MAG: hypothetical protein FJ102_02655 [Deltaproteobacteria bacterium]|nr:hypothetical protein [Deltaproteobacteria bacterium]
MIDDAGTSLCNWGLLSMVSAEGDQWFVLDVPLDDPERLSRGAGQTVFAIPSEATARLYRLEVGGEPMDFFHCAEFYSAEGETWTAVAGTVTAQYAYACDVAVPYGCAYTGSSPMYEASLCIDGLVLEAPDGSRLEPGAVTVTGWLGESVCYE